MPRAEHQRVPKPESSIGLGSLQQYLSATRQIDLLTAEQEIMLGRSIQSGQRALKTLSDPDFKGSPILRTELEAQIVRGATAQQQLIESNLRLVIDLARKHRRRGVSVSEEDLIQEGNFGLFAAARKFDPEMGNRFSTLAVWWIRQAMDRATKNQATSVRLPVHTGVKLRRVERAINAVAQREGRTPTVTEIAEEAENSVDEVRALLSIGQSPISLDQQVFRDGESMICDTIVDGSPTPEATALGKARREEIDRLLSSLEPRERFALDRRFGLSDPTKQTHAQIAAELGMSRESVRNIIERALKKLQKNDAMKALADDV